jgi:hypothetical protein
MFLTMVLYYCDLFLGLSPSSPCFSTTTFRGMALPSIEASFIDRTHQSRSPEDEGRAIPRNVVVEKNGYDGESPKSRSQ